MPSRSSTTEIHDWVRASPYRTGAAASAFLALLVASTAAPLSVVPTVFLGSLLVTVPAAFVAEVLADRVGDDASGTASVDRRRPGARTNTVDEAAADDALARLRERYAAGELDDEAFERRVERLIETADLDAVARRRRGEGSSTGTVTGTSTSATGTPDGRSGDRAAGRAEGRAVERGRPPETDPDAGGDADRTATDPERA